MPKKDKQKKIENQLFNVHQNQNDKQNNKKKKKI